MYMMALSEAAGRLFKDNSRNKRREMVNYGPDRLLHSSAVIS
jgi:hypothetical protein